MIKTLQKCAPATIQSSQMLWPVTMQIQLSRRILTIWRTLPPEVRRFVEVLQINPRPPGALAFPERPNYYEEFIAGYWIGWTVDESTGETIIRVTVSE